MCKEIAVTDAQHQQVVYYIFNNDYFRNESERLNQLLTILLAESINNRDKMFASQIREVQRCLATFDEKG